ncbi:unnamed protein product [Psylliodes chrysocephalus]|uniref:Helicase C-terminal domain-containing protein n=1 Tax=Psylliodes chrysocephalus TaxID=3402493 RepID=A0A9P0GJC3_9CUCU|nr:unnamed protein product [Psylliodes chrysocephala]
MEDLSFLYDKLPVLDRRGNRFDISKEDFKNEEDFQQKRVFAKLHKLKLFQNDLPIAQHKAEIIEKLSQLRVLLIAGDTGCGIMKCLLHQRDNFKLILMSAPINLELFSNYFDDEQIQVIKVPGRLYPIDIKDPYERKREKLDCTPYVQILQMIDEKYQANQKGDMLIFLNGFSEISTLADAVTEYSQIKKNWIVLPLHSSLSLEEQDKEFDYPPEGVRKCIISTNIAETSVTIEGIRFVVDSGKVNKMSYNTNVCVNKLSECSISQDSAKQRSG